MKKNKILTMELIWLTLTIVSLTLFVVETIRKGFEHSKILLIITAISAVMYFFRRTLRKRDEQNN